MRGRKIYKLEVEKEGEILCERKRNSNMWASAKVDRGKKMTEK